MAKRKRAETEPPGTSSSALSRIFHTLLESSEEGILVFERSMRVVFMNRACEELTGKRRDEVTTGAGTCGNLMGCQDAYGQSLAADDTCPVRRLFAELPPAFCVRREMRLRQSGGTEIWVENRYFPVLDSQGKAEYVVAVLRDISEHKAMEEQLLESRKLASFAVLTAGIAHELRNPLGILRSAAEIVSNPNCSASERQEAAEFIKNETMRLDRIIREFLAYARPNPPDWDECDLNEIVRHALEVFQTRQNHCRGVHIEGRLAEGLPHCWVDPAQIHQVLLNLLLNAQHVIGDDGAITVTTGRDGDWLTLEVGDSGPGIPPEEVERIFDPFYTTRPEGSGLGLAVVRRIVTEHRGRIRVERSPLGGAAVTIRLPTHPAERPIPVEPDDYPPPIGAGTLAGGLRRRSPDKGT